MSNNTEFPNLPAADEFAGESGNYRPGGDAQHVSALVREIALDALVHTSGDAKTIEPGVKFNTDSAMVNAALQLLPSQALRDKLLWAVRNIETGKSRVLRRLGAEHGYTFKRARAASAPTTDEGVPGYKEGTIKVGRWEYPSRKYTDGSVERNTKRDGSGEWVAA